MLTPSSSVPSSGRPCSDSVAIDLGEREQALADVEQDLLAAVERDARRHLDEDHEVAFVELGQELRAELARGEPAGDEQRRPRPRARSSARPRIRATHARDSRARSELDRLRILAAASRGPSSARAQRRHQREREDQRAEQRERVGQRERAEDPALDALQREHRDQRGDDDRHRVERRPRHVERGVADERRACRARVSGWRSRAMWITFSTRMTAPSTRMPKSIAPIEIRFAGRPIACRPMNAHEQRDRDHRRDDQRAADRAQEQPHDAEDQQARRTAGCGGPCRACARPASSGRRTARSSSPSAGSCR